MIYRALSLHQPWAWLVLARDPQGRRYKRFETRSWNSGMRVGMQLAIHATLREPELCPGGDLRFRDGVLQALMETGTDALELARGAVLGIVMVRGIYRAEFRSELRPYADVVWDRERLFGDWGPGRYAVDMEIEERFEEPVPARGARGIWMWNRDGGSGARGDGTATAGAMNGAPTTAAAQRRLAI